MNNARTFFVERDGVRLHVHEEGNLDGPLVVFVHGYPDDLTVWDGVAALLKDDMHIVRYDVRGAGKSDAPRQKSDYLMEELQQDLRAVVHAVAPDAPFHLVGHDWGSIQLWASVMDPDLQGRIRSFVSASGPSVDYVAAQLRGAMTSGTPQERLKAVNQMFHSWYIGAFQLPIVPELVWSRRTVGFVESAFARAERVPVATLHSEHRVKNGRHGIQLYRANMPPRLRAPEPRPTRVPVRVIAPAGDTYVSPYIARACEPWAQNAEFLSVEGGHWFFIGAPTVMAHAVREFVGQNA